MSKKWQAVFVISTAAVAISVIVFVMFFGTTDKESRKIGFVMTGETTEIGWNGENYIGIKNVCEKFGIELLTEENIAENTGECAEAVERLISDGAGMVILSSHSYCDEIKDIIKKYPEISFYGNSADYSAENISSYFGRMYQVRYLSGIIAGMQTESNKIGYVAAMPNSEVNRGINAFTLGVKRVNPNAEVVVYWTNSWDDENAETDAVNSLIETEKIDVVTYHQNKNHVIDVAEGAGIYSIGYNGSIENCSEKVLATALWDWEILYNVIVKDYMQGYANSKKHYWYGMETGAVSLSVLSSVVTEDMKAELKKAHEEIIQGRDVFSGEIYSNNGILQCSEDEIISDSILISDFDWYVDGVKMYGE